MKQPTAAETKEAMERLKNIVHAWAIRDLGRNEGFLSVQRIIKEDRDTILTALEQHQPKAVSREDAMNLFSFLRDVYRANGNTGTEFILWLKERGIEVEGQSPDEEE